VNQKPSKGGVYPLLNSSRLEFSNGQPTHEKLSSRVEYLNQPQSIEANPFIFKANSNQSELHSKTHKIP
jgi:hypothetical protein